MTKFFRLALSLILSTAIVLQTEPIFSFVSPGVPPVTEVSKPLEIAKDKVAIIYNSDDHLVKVGESYKQKMKKGTAVTKRTTVYDPETGDIISQKTKQKFEKSGFFNSTAGKIIGAIGLAVLTVVTAGIGAAMLGGAFFGATVVGSLTVGGLIGAAVGSLIGTTALSLLQGASFGDALKAGLISAAAVIATAGIAKILTSGPIQGFLSQISQGFADGVANFATRAANSLIGEGVGQTFGAKVLFQAATRIGSEEFSTTFGKKLGAFGTAAILAFAASAAGAFVNGSNIFSLETFASLGLQAASRGGLAEAFKNENGLGSQLAQQVAGYGLNGVDFTPVAKQFSNFFQGAGEKLGLFTPATVQGQKGLTLFQEAEKSGLGKPSQIFHDESTGEVIGAEYRVGDKSFYISISEEGMRKLLTDVHAGINEHILFQSGDLRGAYGNARNYLAADKETFLSAAPSQENYMNTNPADDAFEYRSRNETFDNGKALANRLDVFFIHDMGVDPSFADRRDSFLIGADTRLSKILSSISIDAITSNIPGGGWLANLTRRFIGNQMDATASQFMPGDQGAVQLTDVTRAEIGQVYAGFKEAIGTARFQRVVDIYENPITAAEVGLRNTNEATAESIFNNTVGLTPAGKMLDGISLAYNPTKLDATQREFYVKVPYVTESKGLSGITYHQQTSELYFRTGLTANGTHEVISITHKITENRPFDLHRERYDTAPKFGDN